MNNAGWLVAFWLGGSAFFTVLAGVPMFIDDRRLIGTTRAARDLAKVFGGICVAWGAITLLGCIV
jgi:hypothetical protein